MPSMIDKTFVFLKKDQHLFCIFDFQPTKVSMCQHIFCRIGRNCTNAGNGELRAAEGTECATNKVSKITFEVHVIRAFIYKSRQHFRFFQVCWDGFCQDVNTVEGASIKF